jgi:hypothetical protein
MTFGLSLGKDSMRGSDSVSKVPVLNISRFALVLAMALMLGSLLAQSVDAKRIPANGVSIAERVQNQRDICELGGGTLEATNTAFGSTITKCKGGKEDGYTCVNTAPSTDCHKGLVRPEQDPFTPPTGGVYEEPVYGAGSQVGTVTGTAARGLHAAKDTDDEPRGEAARKDTKNKGKKGKAGGKRRKSPSRFQLGNYQAGQGTPPLAGRLSY